MRKLIGLIAVLFCGINGAMAQDEITSPSDTSVVYSIVEQMPTYTYKGKIQSYSDYVSKASKKYLKSIDYSGSGTVYLTFVVDVEGNATDIEVLRSLGPELDSLAIKFVEGFPQFNPGMQRGVRVPVQCNVPLSF